MLIASPQQGNLRLSGPPLGQGAGGGARTSDRRVPVDFRADSLATQRQTSSSTLHFLMDRLRDVYDLRLILLHFIRASSRTSILRVSFSLEHRITVLSMKAFRGGIYHYTSIYSYGDNFYSQDEQD
ncbi:hypothetical protein PoB_003654700 [Plakobranchus ocellatus]|uniref:Uncharacterized protein n=1 Tax=Plakobranchus ocellatus TaxID=259542 RepID=A0AAV4ARU3_9GAST|nr:hypothetical protein PoB_003654700 [Plakobranchus ocellatus]